MNQAKLQPLTGLTDADLQGKWTDNLGYYYTISEGWIDVKKGQRDLIIFRRPKKRNPLNNVVQRWNCEDKGDYWVFFYSNQSWTFMKNTPEMVWKSNKGNEIRLYKFPEILGGQWEVYGSKQIISIKDGEAIFHPLGQNHGGNSYEMRDGGSVWKMNIRGEVWVLGKKDANRNSEGSITWTSTFTGEEITWLRKPDGDTKVSDWGAYLARKKTGKAGKQEDIPVYNTGDGVVVNDKNVMLKKWFWCRGHFVSWKGQKIIVKLDQLTGLGKVLECNPRDVVKVKSFMGASDLTTPIKKVQETNYRELLQGRWTNSDGLQINVEGRYATFLHSNNQYRIVFDATPPFMMIRKVEWVLQMGKENDRLYWSDFKDRIEWVREGAAPEKVAFVSPGFVPKPPSAPPKYEEVSQPPVYNFKPAVVSAPPSYAQVNPAPPSYDDAVPPSYEEVAMPKAKREAVKGRMRDIFTQV